MIRRNFCPTLLGPALFVLALVALCTGPVAAEIYHVQLANGEEFDSRYPPEEASWDSDLLLFHSETGNWVGLRRDEVVAVEIETELRGAGRRIDATTVYVGKTANARTPPGAEEGSDPAVALLQQIYEQNQAQQSYSIEQFVEPGETNTGIPVGFTQQVTPPLGLPVENPQ